MRDLVELDAVARGVIAKGRRAFEPSELVSARVRRTVESKRVEGVAVPVWMSGNGAPNWVKVLAGAAVASVATGALAYAVWRPKPIAAPRVAPLLTSPAFSLAVPPPSVSATSRQNPEPSLEPSVSEPPPAVVRAASPVVNKSESLDEEVKLLANVHSAIQNHDGVQALRLLRTYDQQFKKPQLREERSAAGVLALCAAGQIEAARNAKKRFQANWPRSPLTARVIDSCVASK